MGDYAVESGSQVAPDPVPWQHCPLSRLQRFLLTIPVLSLIAAGGFVARSMFTERVEEVKRECAANGETFLGQINTSIRSDFICENTVTWVIRSIPYAPPRVSDCAGSGDVDRGTVDGYGRICENSKTGELRRVAADK